MRIFAPLAAVYVGLVILANWLASTYIVHVPLTPYMAPQIGVGRRLISIERP